MLAQNNFFFSQISSPSLSVCSAPVCEHRKPSLTFKAIKAIKSLITQVFVVVTFYAKDPFLHSFRFYFNCNMFSCFNGDFHLNSAFRGEARHVVDGKKVGMTLHF
jgi:hypothetical protein